MSIKDIKFIQPDESLVDYLDKIYPDRCPELNLSDREIWYRSGQRSVVCYLRSLLETID